MWHGVITDVGAALLADWSGGGQLVIQGASAGDEKCSLADMTEQTDVTGASHALSVIGSSPVTNGTVVKVLITPDGDAYSISQIGIWAKLDSGASTLLALYQCDEGEEILVPSSGDMPDYVYAYYAYVTMDNTGELSVTIDSAALVSQEQLAEALAGKVDLEDFEEQLDTVNHRVKPITEGGTGATSAKAGLHNLGGGPAITLASTDTTWANIYAKLDSMYTSQTAAISIHENAMAILTNGKISNSFAGVVTRSATGYFGFLLFPQVINISAIYTFRISEVSAAGATLGNIYNYAGTLIS